MDAHANFAISVVSTATSPASSGTSLVVTTGQGSRFPAVPFNAVVWPTAVIPSITNAEIVRVTALSADTFTITRAQEGTSARTIVVGDQIAATITAKTFTDIEYPLQSALSALSGTNYQIDLSGDPYKVITTNSTIDLVSTINRATATTIKTLVLFINASGSLRTLTFNPSWVAQGNVLPSNVPANKVALVSFTCKGTAETDVILAYSVQP